MARLIPTDELEQIEKAVRARPRITSAEIADVLGDQQARRTLQFRLKRLVDDGRIVREGEGRWARYSALGAKDEAAVTVSREGEEIRANVRQPVGARKPVGYNREFLDSYRPERRSIFTEGARALKIGRAVRAGPAGRHLRPTDPEPASDRPVVELEPS